jgi:hypothetical protein
MHRTGHIFRMYIAVHICRMHRTGRIYSMHMTVHIFRMHRSGHTSRMHRLGHACRKHRAGYSCRMHRAGHICRTHRAGHICRMHTVGTPGKIFDRKGYGSRPAGIPKDRSTDKGQRDVRKLLRTVGWKKEALDRTAVEAKT